MACSVDSLPSGYLRFRFRWNGREWSEKTLLCDTPENREKAEKTAALIGAEIKAGVFEYSRWFAKSAKRKIEEVGPAPPAPPNPPAPTKRATASAVPPIRAYYPGWIDTKKSPNVRASLEREYHAHMENHVLPVIGDVTLPPGLGDLERLRKTLRIKHLSEKTIKNVINGTLRALVRDAARDFGMRQPPIALAFPGAFALLELKPYDPPEPTPFAVDERDRLLEYYARKTWKLRMENGRNVMAPHYPYFAYVFTLFHTGARPSELAANRIRDLDLQRGTLYIGASRHRGEEGAPKTRRAKRLVKLTRETVEVVRPLVHLRARPDDYLFTDIRGNPIKPEDFYDAFVDAQTAVGISPLRDLYSTKDTYISLALSAEPPVNIDWLETQVGVAAATLRTHYRSFLRQTDRDRMELAKLERPAFVPRGTTGAQR